MAPFEAFYGIKCKTPLYWSELSESKMKVLRFGRKRKLSLRFIRLYEIVERIDLVSYRLSLPSELEKIHNYRSDPSNVIPHSEIELQPDLSYFEEPVKILAWESCGIIKEKRSYWGNRGINKTTVSESIPSNNFEDEIS
ncbi:reverse transcriptase [Gossypium australe]|uniref:Reverse transcriptase n=1 Tax=Gossypium australe TaxID=47621 RepID=A0A5B6WIA7_9ROSI|nr:reverse transcriptase [Gossypium australe]